MVPRSVPTGIHELFGRSALLLPCLTVDGGFSLHVCPEISRLGESVNFERKVPCVDLLIATTGSIWGGYIK